MIRDPADDVVESLDQVKARLAALQHATPTMEKNVSQMRLALIRAEAALDFHQKNIGVLEEVVKAGGRKNHVEVAVDRVPDEAQRE